MKREYFEDHEFQTQLTAEQREFYMGVAMLADDAGWLDWEPAYIASVVYRYEDPQGRLAKAEACATRLVETGRLKTFRCGHAQLPRAGTRSGEHESKVLDRHRLESKRVGTSRLKPTRQPYLTEPHLTSPDLPKPSTPRERAPVKGAPRNGQMQSLRDLVGDPETIIGPRPAGKS
jgi:hypothetical protein